MIRQSATLAVNERLQAKLLAGEKVVHLGFGEAGLPVLPAIGEVLAASVDRNSYGPVAGSITARAAAAGYFTRRGLTTNPDQVLFAPGSKALLYALLAVLPGDVVLPQPSWVSYAAQAALVDKRVIGVPIPSEAGGVPDPDLLEQGLRAARREGAQPGIMIVTLPDNPTGTLPSADLVKRVCEVADRHGLLVISDQIYGDLCHDAQVHSPAVDLPERTIITAGLSKSMALGGYRIGFTRLPEGPLGRQMQADLVGVASEVWSSLAAPMQQVAAHVLGEPPEVTAHVAASRRLHHAVASSVHREFIAAGVSCRPPQAAFYLYPDFAALQPTLAGFGVRSGAQLAEFLLEHHGVGVLAGEEFGDDPAALRFRAATSLLYGADPEQRWSALRSDDPTALPWIADSLSHLRQALTALTDG